jgi:hypothetical protein
MKYFLLVYDKARGELVEPPLEFPVAAVKEAIAMRNIRAELDQGRGLEIVLLGADSLDDLRRTHRRYFLRHGVEEIGAAQTTR